MAEQVTSQQERENAAVGFEQGSNLVQYIRKLFESFDNSRKAWEAIWEECWYNYLGRYQSNINWRAKTEGKGGRSKIFIKLTTLKCNTAHAKICDVLFGGRNSVPFDVEAIDAEAMGIPPDIARDMAAAVKDRLMEYFKKVELEETINRGILELCILGHGILKGPIVVKRKRPAIRPRRIGNMPVQQLDQNVNPYEMVQEEEILAVIDHIPLWEYYTDFNAKNPKEAIGEIHFQRLLPDHFRQYASMGGYIAENVREAARRATSNDPDDKRYIQLGDQYSGAMGDKDERVSVVEFWGLVPVSYLKEAGVEVPGNMTDEESVEALVVVAADGILCKATVNPLGFRPFWGCPCKERPGVLPGMGFAEAMRDSQKMVNSAARLYVDNKAISGNLMVAINLDKINVKKTKNLDIYPGKVWWGKGAANPKEIIDSVNFPDITQGLMEMIEMFSRFSDEETGLPKYTSGEQDSFLNKTATGMSMLMAQANIQLKSVMKNIDNYWIEPIVEAMHAFLNEMNGQPPIPIRIKATGADSLIAKELKLEAIMKAFQVTSTPQDAIFMDRVKAMKEIFRLLETPELLRSDDEIKALMQEMTKQANAPKDMREFVDLDRMYPMLTRSEQLQVLQMLGITPDTTQIEPMQAPQAAAGGEGKGTNVPKGI